MNTDVYDCYEQFSPISLVGTVFWTGDTAMHAMLYIYIYAHHTCSMPMPAPTPH